MQLVSISSALKAVSFSGMQMDLFIEPGICLNSDGSGALDRTHHPWDQEFVGGLGLSEFWEPLRWHRRPQNDEGTASALIMLHERSFLLLRPKSVTPGPRFPKAGKKIGGNAIHRSRNDFAWQSLPISPRACCGQAR